LEEKNLEQIFAANLTALRREKEWTQAELAEKINYSDKSVSKWERGDGLPDLKVLIQLADLFGVTLDCFITEDGAKQQNQYKVPKQKIGFRVIMELLAVSIVFLFATVVYVGVATYARTYPWTVFVWALPVSFAVLTLFNIRWKFRVCAVVFGSIIVWTLLAATYLQLLSYNLWMLFLIGIPAQAAIIFGTQMWRAFRQDKRKKNK
jgi:transcriptional regulator with XRE-family HTH domain